MIDRERRAFPSNLEIRSNGDGRTISGIAAPLGTVADISDLNGRYTETIERGALVTRHHH